MQDKLSDFVPMILLLAILYSFGTWSSAFGVPAASLIVGVSLFLLAQGVNKNPFGGFIKTTMLKVSIYSVWALSALYLGFSLFTVLH